MPLAKDAIFPSVAFASYNQRRLNVKYYRVSVKPPDISSRVLCFTQLEMALGYVLGWYGESCNLYEISGTRTRDYEASETVQIFASKDSATGEATSTELREFVVEVNVLGVKLLGRFTVTGWNSCECERTTLVRFDPR